MKTKVFFIGALFSFIICIKAFSQLPEKLKTVDLGLSSGTLWANMNLGATDVTEYGNYFAWGETTIRNSLLFEQDNCPLYKITKIEYIDDDGFTVTETIKGYTKYVLEADASKHGYDGFYDNKTELEWDDDAACVLWGESWKLPTKAQWNELVSECTWQPVTLNGTNGYKVIGKNNKYIFLPMGGYCFNTWKKQHLGEYACYWSSSLGGSSEGGYGFTETGNTNSGVLAVRYIGRLIRAVSTLSSNSNYTLTYQIDGYDYKAYILEVGEAITPEPNPMKEGYTFSGWSEIPETMPAHDVTVTGTFSINSYNLTYMVDGEEYKCYELGYGTNITPEIEPSKEGYTFSGWSEIPETMPDHDVIVTGSFIPLQPLEQCATPTIAYQNGQLTFKSATEDVQFVSEITDTDIKKNFTATVNLNVTYMISVYATKEGYIDSEVATATLCWIEVEPQKEGITENDEDAMAGVKAVPVLIQSEGNQLMIEGAQAGTPIVVYDLSGRLIATATAADTVTRVTVGGGEEVVVVKVGDKVVKVKR